MWAGLQGKRLSGDQEAAGVPGLGAHRLAPASLMPPTAASLKTTVTGARTATETHCCQFWTTCEMCCQGTLNHPPPRPENYQHLPVPAMELVPEAKVSLPPDLWSPTRDSYWQNKAGRQFVREPGKCSLQTTSPGITEQSRERQVGSWDTK